MCVHTLCPPQGDADLQFYAAQGATSLPFPVLQTPDTDFLHTLSLLQGETALQFYAAQGAASLADEVSRIGPAHNFTRLVPDLSAGEDPDDALSRGLFEKGFYFLYLQVRCASNVSFEQPLCVFW
jgi:hypothetical protein